ncbi:helix-turn-helix transcriptional regulator [Paenibacillus chungangensis]|uniref:Helix-turn-helix domain-containing protein n=1 Tax=Paenibacillus chungangensis TaxID=696535 RepID=A0ABW3HKJ0_9BACL
MQWNLYTKYMLAFLFILCLPIATLGSFLYIGAADSLREEIEDAGQVRLKQAMDTLDQYYLSLVSTTLLLSTDPRLTPYQLRSDTFSKIQAIHELSRYKLGNVYLEDVLFHISGDSLIYTAEGVLNQQTFAEKYILSGVQETESYLRQLLNAKSPYVRPADILQSKPGVAPEKTILSVGMPFPMNTISPNGIVVYLINREKLFNSIMPILGEFKGNVLLYNENNQLLTSYPQDSQLDQEFMSQMLGMTLKSSKHAELVQVNNYSVSWIRSSTTGWTCITILQKDQFYSRVLKLNSLITYLLLIVALLGILIAGYLAYRFYKPVQHIVHRIRGDFERASSIPVRKEFEFIIQSIDKMALSRQELIGRMESQRQWIHDQFLVMLLRGDFVEEEDIRAFKTKHQLTLTGNSFVVFSLTFKQTERQVVRKALNSMQAVITDNIYLYPIEYPRGKLVCIAGLHNGLQSPENVTERAAQLVQSLFHQHVGEYPTVSSGNAYVTYKSIHHSYIEVMAADEYTPKFPVGSLIRFQDILTWDDKESSTTWYSPANKATLLQSIKQGDEALATESLRLITSEISNLGSVLMSKCMTSDLINAVYKLLHELTFPGSAEEIRQLLAINDIVILENELTTLVSRMCEHVNTRQTTETNELKLKVVAYMRENFANYDFNLDQAAEHFEVSTSYLSRFIKEHTGITFSDYIFELRLEHVKNELMHTNKSIKDIIQGVGYINVSYFIERFKKREGVTPGEYRKSSYQSS